MRRFPGQAQQLRISAMHTPDDGTVQQSPDNTQPAEQGEPSDAQSQFDAATRLSSQGHASQAFRCYVAAAAARHPEACYIAAMSCIRGIGTRRNYAQGAKYLSQGAEAGNADAQCALADMYQDGWILAKDEVAATRWFMAAADQGHTRAQYRIGRALWHGTPELGRDPGRARRYLAAAAEEGHDAAATLLEKIDPLGTTGAIAKPPIGGASESPAATPVDGNAAAPHERVWPKRTHPLVLIDTSVLLKDPDVVRRVITNKGVPCITTTILAELDFNKTNRDDKDVAEHARRLLREMAKSDATSLAEMPGGGAPLPGDTVQAFSYEGSQLLVVGRDQRRGYDSNDARIIAVATDYAMLVITADAGLKVRAQAVGVEAHVWVGPQGTASKSAAVTGEQGRSRQRPTKGAVSAAAAGATDTARRSLRPFLTREKPISDEDALLSVSIIPKVGDTVRTSAGTLNLVREISAGGEGTIFETDQQDTVCKIYHHDRLTTLRKRKIDLMLSRRILKAGLCWPSDRVTNAEGEFVGYVMPRAQGHPMQRSMFVKPALERNFPEWTRVDLVNLCLAFLEHVKYLHQLNIIIGDINPLNVLVTGESNRVAIVDTDSFQIEGFPCPVGTINFTPPEIQGADYATFLRTSDHELFAVATMLFMILHPGKPPYAQQGGGDPAANIKGRQFAYPYHGAGTGKAPEGPWQLIWANLPGRVQEGFWKVFQGNQRVRVDEWGSILKAYRSDLLKGWHSNELFPTTFKIRDPIEVVCGNCKESVVASQRRYQEVVAAGKAYFCGKCVAKIRLKILANKAREAHVAARNTRAARNGSWLSPVLRPSAPATVRGASSARWPQGVSRRPSGAQRRGGLFAVITSLLGKIFRL